MTSFSRGAFSQATNFTILFYVMGSDRGIMTLCEGKIPLFLCYTNTNPGLIFFFFRLLEHFRSYVGNLEKSEIGSPKAFVTGETS